MHRFSTVRGALIAGTLVAPLTLTLTRSAFAQSTPAPLPPFGSQGQVVIDDLVGGGTRPMLVDGIEDTVSFGGLFSYSHETTDDGGRPPSRNEWETVSFSPTGDVFIAPRVSLGMELSVEWGTTKQTGSSHGSSTGWTFAGAPRIGYVFPLGGGLSLWPRVALGGETSTWTGHGEYGPDKTTAELAALELPLVLRINRWLFMSVEPELVVTHGAESSVESHVRSSYSWTTANVEGYLGAGLVL